MLPASEIAGITDRIQARREWIAAVSEIAPPADRSKLVFTIENYAGICSPCITFDDFMEFRKAVPSLCLTFDSGNAFTGEDPVASLRKSFPHMRNVHIKDWTTSGSAETAGNCRMPDGKYYDMTLPMSGIVPIREIMTGLARLGYRNNIVLEYLYADYPVPVQREMIARMKDILRRESSPDRSTP